METNNKTNQFLKKHHFFDYLNFANYSPVLDSQITDRLGLSAPLNVVIPLSTKPSRKNLEPYLVLDLGGTYLRLYLCQNSAFNVIILAEQKLSFYQNKIYTPTILISDLFESIGLFIQTHKDQIKAENLQQIIFSFGNALQPEFKSNQLDGKILYWGKNHQQKDLLGINLGSDLQAHLRQNGFPKSIVQLINDGTLSALAGYSTSASGDCLASLIVGTGTNLNIGFEFRQNFYLANLEFGDFEFAPYSTFDEQLNVKVITPNHFRTEKMFAGAWQNQLFFIILEFAIKEKLINSPNILELIKPLNSDQLETLLSKEFDPVNSLELTSEEWRICQTLWNQITIRGATLCALVLTRLILQLRKLDYLTNRLILVPSGALLEHSHPFQESFHNALQQQPSTHPALSNQKIITIHPENTICQAAAALLDLLNLT